MTCYFRTLPQDMERLAALQFIYMRECTSASAVTSPGSDGATPAAALGPRHASPASCEAGSERCSAAYRSQARNAAGEALADQMPCLRPCCVPVGTQQGTWQLRHVSRGPTSAAYLLERSFGPRRAAPCDGERCSVLDSLQLRAYSLRPAGLVGHGGGVVAERRTD